MASQPLQNGSAWKGTADCRNCTWRAKGLFGELTEHELDLIHAPIDCLLFPTAHTLFGEGQATHGVYSIKRGLVKLVRLTGDGRQRIVRVLREGDVLGMEALTAARYDASAMAMTEVAVCRIPLSVVRTLDSRVPRLHRALLEKWRQALKDADDWLADLNFGSARQRVSHFVLKMRQPESADEVTLFSREDMGAMLDLKLETVSREISALVREGAIEPLDKGGRHYRIVDAQRLRVG